jgi:hypothetical protein
MQQHRESKFMSHAMEYTGQPKLPAASTIRAIDGKATALSGIKQRLNRLGERIWSVASALWYVQALIALLIVLWWLFA